ncbi:MAG: hypothetical protein IPL55_22995 [Saprospiraceae bacterium]|nr:hypothetical protein [Saprospiraceae bacterium]
MAKLISWVALGFFVVVVPFISWYYLKQGYNYRKKLLSEVVIKDSLLTNDDSLSLLKGKTTVLVINSNTKTNYYLEGLYNQFKNVNGFQIASFDSIDNTVHLPEVYISNFMDKYKSSQIALFDTSLHLRNVYNNESESIKKLIEHIAIILPRQKEADIQMKN